VWSRAITPSTNPGATPANNIVNALKGRNAIILAPSPKGQSTLALLLDYVHAELDRVGAPRDLVLRCRRRRLARQHSR
jgi:sulfoacetaldehyde dehydrogenase